MSTNSGYKWLIDSLVELANSDVTASRIRKNSHPNAGSDTSEEKAMLFQSMNASERELIAKMLEESRISAIHDVANFLESATINKDLRIDAKGEYLKESPFESYHFDFIARIEGEEWPY